MPDLRDRLAALSPAAREELLRTLGARSAIPRLPDGPAPLSAEQRRLWFVLHLAPEEPLYTIPLGFRLRGPLDAGALGAALEALVARHETLRTAFRESAGEPVQEVLPPGGFRVEVVDLRDHPFAGPEAGYLTASFPRRGFDLRAGETFRALLVRQGEEDHRLLLALHHMAADGASAAVLLRELSELYAARREGRPAALPDPPLRFRDWAAWQARGGDEAARTRAEGYWRTALEGAPHLLDLPTDRPRPPAQPWEGEKHAFTLPAAVAEGAAAFARRERTTLYAAAAAAWALVLARHAGAGELLLGTVVANRERAELQGAVGFFANTLPLRVRLDDDPTAAELARRVGAATAEAIEHGALPFDRVVELAGVRRDFARPPLVQAVLSFAEAPAPALPGVEVEPVSLDSGTAAFELALTVERDGDRLRAALQYPVALWDPESARALAAQWLAALSWMVENPVAPVSGASLAAPEARAATAEWGDGGRPLAREPVHAAFLRWAESEPERVALVAGAERVTYGALAARAERVARGLAGLGVGPESRVGVCLRRTPELVAAVLGVLRAGAAYVPLDPDHPPARHRASLETSGARWVLSAPGAEPAAEALRGTVRVLRAAGLDGQGAPPPPESLHPESLAYVLFTSGSTGGPKGVEVPHRAATALAAWTGSVPLDGAAEVLAQGAVTFDVSVGEIFGILGSGRTLVLVENALAPLPPGTHVQAANMTPSAAAELLAGGRFPAGVEAVLLGGEPVPHPLVEALHALPGRRRVLNLYGPTEDTVYTTCAELFPADPVRLGAPIAGGRVYVLDAALRHAAPDEPGELWTAGAGMARGYAARPGLTAERFRPDPHGAPGSRMYRTLDRARWRSDGTLEYLGRADQQVKVRGYRIELEEVEQALAAHPAVARAAAAAFGAGSERRLAAFLVPAGEARPAAAELRTFLRERLPEYMVPATFAWRDVLPRNASGKLDRRALHDPGLDGAAEGERVPPRSELEARIAAAWAAVLGVDEVGVTDDFFDLGGHSVLALRLAARLRDELGIELTLAELLRAPTVEGVAGAADRSGEPRVALPLVALQTFGDRPPLFLAPPGGGHVTCYRGLAVHLAPEQPVYALQPKGIDGSEPPLRTVEEMAAHYLEGIRRFRPAGPYRLAGWSFGGVIAWEMARRLAEEGEEVDLLALLDTAPLEPGAVRGDARETAEVIWHTVAGVAGWGNASRVDVDTLRGLSPRDAVLAMIRTMDVPQILDGSRVDQVLALTEVRAANLEAQSRYAAGTFPGRLTYLRTAGSHFADAYVEGMEFWASRALGGTEVRRVSGSHGSILQDPHVLEVAAVLLEAGCH